MPEIKIDEPGAGEWIMERAGGSFDATCHSIARYSDGRILGGFVVSGMRGRTVEISTAGEKPGWCSKELLWMVFHYVFKQLNCTKATALVRSDNHRAMSVDMAAGFKLEAIIRDVFDPGVHLMILSMGVADCKYLAIIPRSYLPGSAARAVTNGR